MIAFSAASFAQVFVSVRIGPPALPVYAQPVCPGPGYIWTPGYWAWNDDEGYYWVPGTWVVAPVGMLWTPGYWGWNDGFYVWHAGYWGPHVGFYGGINYGFGYTGVGFAGGYWERDRFFYNRSVTNVNVTNVTNVYTRRVVVNYRTHVSFNGGRGGVSARPTRAEEIASREQHREPLAEQMHHQQAAAQNRELFARENHGRPAVAATLKPADFNRHDVIAAKAAGARYHAPRISPREARGPAKEANRPLTARNSRENSPANRPFTPPAKNRDNQRTVNPTHEQKGNRGNNPVHEPRDKGREQAPVRPQRDAHPKSEARPAPAPREAAPRANAPRHESAPPAPRREKTPPAKQHEKPPKPDKEHNPSRER